MTNDSLDITKPLPPPPPPPPSSSFFILGPSTTLRSSSYILISLSFLPSDPLSLLLLPLPLSLPCKRNRHQHLSLTSYGKQNHLLDQQIIGSSAVDPQRPAVRISIYRPSVVFEARQGCGRVGAWGRG